MDLAFVAVILFALVMFTRRRLSAVEQKARKLQEQQEVLQLKLDAQAKVHAKQLQDLQSRLHELQAAASTEAARVPVEAARAETTSAVLPAEITSARAHAEASNAASTETAGAAAERRRPMEVGGTGEVVGAAPADLPAETGGELLGTSALPSPPRSPAPQAAATPVAPPPRAAAPIASPPGPDPLAAAFGFVRELLFGGNTVVRAGIVVLLVGVVLALRLAAEHDMLPIELRFAAAAALAIALVGFGFRQRVARPEFARTLQGGGVAGLYLVVFFAFRSYQLLPPALAFGLLAAIAVFSGALAVLQSSLSLILIAEVFGFLAPLLASTGKGSHVGLFSYYLLLNLVIAGIAWFKAWRPLNLVGFAFTFGVASAWGVLKYEPAHFASTEPFLIAFFLLYVAIPVLFALRHPGTPRGWVDGSLVFGTPLAALGLQWSMVHERPFAMAYTALGMAAIYLGLALWMKRRMPDRLAALGEAFLPIGAGFATLAIPYGFDNHNLTGAAWALEGAGLYWIGARQSRWLSRLAGVALQFLAGGALAIDPVRPTQSLPLLNTWFLAGMLLGASSLCVAYLSHAARDRLRNEWRWVQSLIAWGLLFVVYVGLTELDAVLPAHESPGGEIAWFGALALGLELASRKLGFRPGRYPGLALWPLMLFFVLRHHYDFDRVQLARGGWFGWPFYAGAMLLILRRFVPEAPAWVRFAHPLALWLWSTWCVSLVDQTVADAIQLDRNYVYAASLVTLAAIAIVVQRVAAGNPLYVQIGIGGLTAMLLLRALQANMVLPGSNAPLPYLPLLNVLDLAVLFGLGAILLWLRRESLPGELRGITLTAVCGMAFVWWNGMLARSVHHYAGVPFRRLALWDSAALQMSISLSWTVIALVLMIVAHKQRVRPPWFAGAVLLGVIVLKLFALDLAELSALAKIGTFLGCGLLLLLIGYVAPMPPTDAAKRDAAPETPA